jgi:FtsP/CotA-like multicopper oxidase with cupredoxin domain
MKKVQRGSFKLNPIAASIVIAMASQFSVNVALAGSGFGSGLDISKQPIAVPAYYANSPAVAVQTTDVNGTPVLVSSGKAMRKFVDTLPVFGSAKANKANNLGQYIPVAVAEANWVNPVTGAVTTDDYYEIAAVEYSEQMHSDLPKATHLRGYVQLMTPGLALKGVVGKSFTTDDGQVLNVVDNPHHLGPVIQAAQGTAVRVKFTNLLPVGGNLFLPVDKTITGAGLGPDGKTYYTENRAEIHLVGGEAPWISAGSPHQWVAPAGETAAYAAGIGKGSSAQNVPDMADPGAGSTTLYFPNAKSARFTFYHDRTSGLTRLNTYAGLEAGYVITDSVEQGLISSGAIPADQIPLIIEDKTFVPANVAQQDAKWDTAKWGAAGDLWFPHVYETNQNPNSFDGTNPVGRWDFGPWFWPIFTATADLPSGEYGNASFVPEAYQDTPVINGTAYPSLTVDPKAYRFRILNASNDRYVNLGLYKADTTPNIAPKLDLYGNPIVDANGVQQYFTGTEVKMAPAVAVDANGTPATPTSPAGAGLPYDPNCLCQYPALPQLQPALANSRAWPIDARIGGAPDPASVGPDFIAIGNDGGLLPNPVDIPSQPVTYESNRRSVTVGNVYGYGLLVGPSERSDVIVDFSAYAGQTLILYNDAPTPFPFNDTRVDYFTGAPDQTAIGGAYSTMPGYGPNTRTMMQIKVNSGTGVPYTQANGTVDSTGAIVTPAPLSAALAAAYKASQPAPIVPETAYNAAFGTSDSDNYAHVATGSVAQPTLDFATTGTQTITGVNLISSGGQLIVGTTNIVGNAIPGSGTGYDPLNPPTVVFDTACGNTAQAFATVDPSSHQVTNVTLGVPGQATVPSYGGYTCAPLITFSSAVGLGAQAVAATSKSQSLPVLTKAEQELFDAAGRYNSTGGVELPLTSGLTQTTVPLNYTDSPTEFIADGETQIWKLVDNGFWSNSMHFDMVDVQLINRVGWDGTVKVPASNEVGWKDTLRLNPLEDVIIAMRPKNAAVPFGLPASVRAQDPSLPLGFINRATQLPFMVDPAVTESSVTYDNVGNAVPVEVSLLATSVNTDKVAVVDNPNLLKDLSNLSNLSKLSYDNEFTWGTAILGHAENDFTRPIVFHPTVAKPDAPSGLSVQSGNGLTWVDTTPVATSKANPKNEQAFKIMAAIQDAQGNIGSWMQVGSALANAQSWNISQATATPVGVGNTVYKVIASNVAGDSADMAPVTVAALVAPTMPSLVQAFITPATSTNDVTVTLTWQDSSNTGGGIGYQVYRATSATGPWTLLNSAKLPSGTTSYEDNTVVEDTTYYYEVAADNGFGSATSSVASLKTGITVPLAPTGVSVSFPGSYAAGSLTTTGTLSVTDVAFNEVSYLVQSAPATAGVACSTVTTWSTLPNLAGNTLNTKGTLTALDATAQYGAGYCYQVAAVNAAGQSAWVQTSTSTATLSVVSAATSLRATATTLTWVSNRASTTGNPRPDNMIEVSVNGGAFTALGNAGAGVTSYPITTVPGNVYSYRVTSFVAVGAGQINAVPVTVSYTAVPVAPAAPTIANVVTNALTLNWTAVTGATSYTVQYATSATGPFVNVKSALAATTLNVTALKPNTTYYFRVVAVNASGSNNGAVTGAVTTMASTPAVPTGFASSAVSSTGYKLGWTAVTGATGYNVLLNGAVVSANQPAASYGVTGVASGTSFGPYTVQACSNNGTTCSAESATSVNVLTTPEAPAAPTTANIAATSLTLNWTAVTGATTYTVQYATSATGSFTNVKSASAATTWNVTPLKSNSTYYFRVAAVNASGSSNGATTGAVLTLPSATATASNGTRGGTISGGLNFTPVAGVTYAVNWTGPATGSTAVTSSGQQITFATVGTYSMTLTATNASGSVTSAPVSVTVQ